jgi:LacI family transcriptional regulator
MGELYGMADPVPCVMAANYKLFVGVSRFLARRAKEGRMPYLASFDDMADLIHIQSNCVVSVAQPMQEIGAQAAELLLRRMRGDSGGYPEIVRLPTELRILSEEA